jgi:hypothetical protein
MRHPSPHRRSHHGRRHRIAATLAIVALALVGCSTPGDDGAARTSSEGVTADRGVEPDVAEEAADADDAADAEAAEDADPDLAVPAARRERHVIRSAELVLEVRDSEAAAEQVVAIAEDAGGAVAQTDLERDEEGVVRGRISLHVPSEALDETVELLDALGDAVPVRRLDETDVTAEITDLGAELTNLLAYEEQLRELLADVREHTADPDDLLPVFDRVNEVRADIDRAEARLTMLEDRVAYARVDVTLRPTIAATPVGDPGWAPGDTARAALATTSRALATLSDLAIRAVLTGLPLAATVALPLALLALGIRAGLRRRGHADTRGDTPEDPPTPGSAPSAGTVPGA